MADNIGLAIVVSAKTDPLERGLARASLALGNFEKAGSKTAGAGALNFDPVAASLKRATRGLKDVQMEAVRTQGALGKMMKYGFAGAVSGGTAAAGMIGFDALSSMTGGISDFVTDSIKQAASIETMTGGFETMLGSVERAKDLMGELRGLAANSPLTFKDAAMNGQNLLGFGIAADQVAPTLRALGDIAAGDSDKLGRLAQNFGQVAAAGRLTGSELKDFTQNGVPMIDALATAMKKPTTQIKLLAEEGKIGFSDTVKAFKVLTEEGGLFYGRGEKYSKTFAGSMDRLKDGVETLKGSFGQMLIEELGLAKAATDAEKFTDWIKSGVNELRPAVRLLGEAGRAGVQLANEAGRFAFEVAKIGAEAFTVAIPGTKDLPDQLSKILKDVQNFKLDNVSIARFGLDFADGMLEGLGLVNEAFKGMGNDFQTSILDPLKKTAGEVQGIVTDIKSVIDSVKMARGAVGTVVDTVNPLKALNPQQAIIDKLRADMERAQKAKESGLPLSGEIPTASDPITRALDEVKKRRDVFRAGVLERAGERDRLRGIDRARDWAADNYSPAAALAGGGFDAFNAFARVDRSSIINRPLEVPKNAIPADTVQAAAAANKQFRDPLAMIRESETNLTDALKRGLITDDVFTRAMGDTLQDAIRTGGVDRDFRLSPSMEFGSSAAASAISAYQGSNGPDSLPSLIKQLIETSQRQLEEQRRMVDEYRNSERPAIVHLPR